MYVLECWEGSGAGGEEDAEEDALRTLLDPWGRTGLDTQESLLSCVSLGKAQSSLCPKECAPCSCAAWAQKTLP